MPGPFKAWCHYHDSDPAVCGGRHREVEVDGELMLDDFDNPDTPPEPLP